MEWVTSLEPVSSEMFCLPAMVRRVSGCWAARASSPAVKMNLWPASPMMTTVGEPIKEVLNTGPWLAILSSNHPGPSSFTWALRKLRVSLSDHRISQRPSWKIQSPVSRSSGEEQGEYESRKEGDENQGEESHCGLRRYSRCGWFLGLLLPRRRTYI